jgi:thiol:disulfide interchange protein DsbD
MLRSLIALLAALLVLLPAAASGQAPEDPFGVEIAPIPAPAGGAAPLAVLLRVPPEHHLYRDSIEIRLDEPGPFSLGEADFPLGTLEPDPAFPDRKREAYHEPFTVSVPLAVAAGTAPGTQELVVTVRYQGCKGNLCFLPRERPVPVAVSVVEGGASPPTAALERPALDDANPAAVRPAAQEGAIEAPPPSGQGDTFQRMREKGLGWLVLFVFGAGFLVSLTPCVLPMIPITIGIIGARAAGSRWRAFSLSLAYVAGLALVYTALGATAALTGSIFGAWMQNVWVVGTVAVFFAAMGLAMFGLFDVAVPSGISTRLNRLGGAGYGGAFVVGMVGALVAGPCSGPVVAALMVLVGAGGEVMLGVALMLAFSLGMGVLFLLAGLFSSAIMRPGAWMESVKRVFGVIMLLGAIWFAQAHLPALAAALLTAAVLVGTAVHAWSAARDDGPNIQRAHRGYSVLAGLVGLWFLAAALVPGGRVPSPRSLFAAPDVPAVAWQTDEAAAVERARAEGKPLIVDFTADWCAACKELEHITYVDPRVVAAAAGFVTVKIDSTRADDPNVKELLARYDVKGLPTVVFVLPDGTTMDDLTVTGFVGADDFLARMQEARTRAE